MVKVMRSIVRGPLAPYVAGFAAELLGQGYTRTSAEQHVCFIAHLDRWLLSEGLGVKDLSESAIEQYLEERRAAGYVEYRSTGAVRPLLAFLAPLGVLPAEQPIRLDAVEDLLSRYRGYLVTERGLAPETVTGYMHVARGFITSRARGEQLDLAGLTLADVIGFVLASCLGRATGSAKLIVTVTRSLLDWLHLTGMVPVSLAAAVPAVAGWKLAGLPQALTPTQLRALLSACDRRTPTGCRDYAIVLLLARLGLRAGEVARLCLDDIDWRRGELRIVGKGNRGESLPLPADVGAAITTYLRRGRPHLGAGPKRLRPRPRAASGLDCGRHRQCRQRRRRACRARPCPRPPAAAQRRHRHVAGGQFPGRGRPGSPSPIAVQHRDLCQGRSGRTGGAGPALASRGRWRCVVTDALRDALADYLALRRALGYRLDRPEKLLDQFLNYLEATHQEVVTLQNALDWAQLPVNGASNWWGYRLSTVRGFATYLHALDPAHEVPAAQLLPQRPQRATPYVLRRRGRSADGRRDIAEHAVAADRGGHADRAVGRHRDPGG
jgi:integrase/recombinase XerD